jgi:hypothetical protein
MTYRIFVNKEISTLEYSSLMQSVGWDSDYPEELVCQSMAAYPFIAHARSVTGALWGYVSAFSAPCWVNWWYIQ